MDAEDARRLSPAEQHERRRQVIRAYKRKVNKSQIARDVGLSDAARCKIIGRYEAGGMAALAPRVRGRRTGDKRVLTQGQEVAIQRTICDRRPEQLKMEFALWSRAAVMQRIEREYGIMLHLRSVGKYLARWGFTPQKPIKRADDQSQEAVRAWLQETYPAIAERARAEDAEIHWGDETALVNTDVRGRSFAPRGKARWMIIDGAFNHEKLIEFFEALVADAGRKVFLILDNRSVHHCRPVKAWLAEHPARMEVFDLPS